MYIMSNVALLAASVRPAAHPLPCPAPFPDAQWSPGRNYIRKGNGGNGRNVKGGSSVQDFIQHFTREPDGSWRCKDFAEITTISGRIQVSAGTHFMPGTVFMGVDIVKLLENEASRQFGSSRFPR
jgi:hypothetical protein